MFKHLRMHALALWSSLVLMAGGAGLAEAASAHDPGPRGGPAGAGGPVDNLSPSEQAFFDAGAEVFPERQSVQGTVPDTEAGLGPRFNLDSCGGCHAHPAMGGTSPAVNPQVALASAEGATNQIPFFVKLHGPIREARFRFNPDGSRDGGAQALFTISGHTDAPGCVLEQPDFGRAAFRGNLSLRIPTPTFGLGLVETISDGAILANMNAQKALKEFLGISGRPNRSGNDGTITKFGWKAQNPSLVVFSGEAYNVEQGVTNELFGQEREQDPACQFNPTPESDVHFDAMGTEIPSDATLFALFMRFLAAPTPAPDTDSIVRGRSLFSAIGCAVCHTPTLTTGSNASPALSNKEVRLFSDLLLHGMGARLADEIVQGGAGTDEFRTAPLWGLGQRLFFLHDGRTTDLVEAIRAHASPATKQYRASEANRVISNYEALPEWKKQDLLNFLRSL